MLTFQEYQLKNLKRDFLFEKIPKNKIWEIINDANQKGKYFASKQLEYFHNQSIRDWLSGYEVKLVEEKIEQPMMKTIFAFYEPNKSKITYHNISLKKLRQPFKELTEENILIYVLLHECFHVLDHKEKPTYKDKHIVYRMKIGNFNILPSKILQFDELVANAFAFYLIKKLKKVDI